MCKIRQSGTSSKLPNFAEMNTPLLTNLNESSLKFQEIISGNAYVNIGRLIHGVLVLQKNEQEAIEN